MKEVVRPRPPDLSRSLSRAGHKVVKRASVLEYQPAAVVRLDLDLVVFRERFDEPGNQDAELVPVALSIRHQSALQPWVHHQPEQVNGKRDSRDTQLPRLEEYEVMNVVVEPVDQLRKESHLRAVQLQRPDAGLFGIYA